MIQQLVFIKYAIERVCDRKDCAFTPEFEKFLYGFLKERFKISDDDFPEEISKIYRIRLKELELAIEDAIVRYKNQRKVVR
jgi:hypothetical protein